MSLNGGTFSVKIDLKMVGDKVVVVGAQRAKRAVKGLGREITTAGIKAQSARAQFANLAGAFTGIIAAKAAAQAIKSFLTPAIQMQAHLQGIAGITGVARKELDQFQATALKVAAKTPFDPNEIVQTMRRLYQVTGSIKEAQEAIFTASDISMASMGKINLMKSAEFIGAMVKSFGINADQVETAADRLVVISRTMGVPLESFADKFQRLGSAAKLSGQSMDEAFKIGGLLLRQTSDPASSWTALRRMAFYIQDREDKLPVKVFDEITGQPRKMMDVYADLLDEYKKDTKGMTSLIGEVLGKKIGPALVESLTQMEQLSKKLDIDHHDLGKHLGEQMFSGKGALGMAREEVMKSAQEQLKLVGAAWQAFLIEFGTHMLPSLGEFAKTLKGILEGLTSFMKENPAVAGVLATGVKWIGMALATTAILAAFKGVGAIAKIVMTNVYGIGAAGTTAAAAAAGGMASTLTPALNTASTAALTLKTRLLAIGKVAGKVYIATKAIETLGRAAAGPTPEEIKKGDRTREIAEMILAQGVGTAHERSKAKMLTGRAGILGSVEGALRAIGGEIPIIGGFLGSGPDFEGSKSAAVREIVKAYDKMKKRSDEMAKNAELGENSFHNAYKQIQLGGKEMEKIRDIAKGIVSYDPPQVRMAAFYQMQKQMQAAAGTLPGGTAESAQAANAVKLMETIHPLIVKATRGEATPNELAQIQKAAEHLGAVATHFNVLMPGLVSAGLLKSLRTDVLSGLLEMGSKDNLAFMQSLGLMSVEGGVSRALTPEGTSIPQELLPGGERSSYSAGGGIQIPMNWVPKMPFKAPGGLPPWAAAPKLGQSYMAGTHPAFAGASTNPAERELLAADKAISAQQARAHARADADYAAKRMAEVLSGKTLTVRFSPWDMGDPMSGSNRSKTPDYPW